ncbi:MAG: radical SAM protein [Thermomicrobiales bacterium]|jgi:MoaA/NifB/PqqE/SkfB family radical SAM enzyme|nr:MAG: radical SAM protein [Thermomicrobiales bacterium]
MSSESAHAKTLHWRINCFCNRKCPFCYGPQQKHEIDLDRSLPVLQRFVEHGIETFILTGGEPLLSKKIDRVLAFLKARGTKVVLYTNCDFFDFHEEAIIDFVDTLCVPIDGASEYTHDMVRGRNNMRAVVDVLNRYATSSSPLTIKVGTVVGRNNVHELRGIQYLLDKYKIDTWKLYQYLRYSDRDLQKLWTNQQLGVTETEYRSAVQGLLSVEPRRTRMSASSEFDRECSYFMMNPDLDIIVPIRDEDGTFEDRIICNAETTQPAQVEALWREKVDVASYQRNLVASNF